MNSKIKYLALSIVTALTLNACDDYLDVPPLNFINEFGVYASESGIDAYMTTLYAELPIEDFNYTSKGFNTDGYGFRLGQYSGEAMAAAYDDINSIGTGGTWSWWSFNPVRNVDLFIEKLPQYAGNFSNKTKLNAWMGEAYFIRAYYYFAMTKRHGGVPIIKEPQDYDPNNIDVLKIPRNTEQECYDFIAEDLDKAIGLLPEKEDILGKGRATKYAALALKARAMLYAGSIAQYGTVELDGLVGIDKSLANHYFDLAYKAANTVIASGQYALYTKNANKEKNFAELFLATDSPENIFIKYYKRPTIIHGWDVYFIPYQYRGVGYSSNMNPTLEFAEKFERLDGTPAHFTQRIQDTYFDDPAELFQGLDARFGGSIIYPNAIFKNEPCDMQKGLILENGSKKEDAVNYESSTYKAQDGTVYHVVGKSGLGKYSGNMTGLFIRKYLDESMPQSDVMERYSDQHWIDYRYAEVILNAAEAAVEMNNTAYKNAILSEMNKLRDRAALKPLNISDLTIAKVRQERRIELAFENHNYWDIRRWRVADKEIEAKAYTGLWPYLDIRNGKYKFEIGRPNNYNYTFLVQMYYEPIPGGEIAKNGKLVQNPFYK